MILRRNFITLLGGAVVWPLAARAQQGDRVRRISVLMAGDENDPLVKTYVSAFIQALAGLGWTDGRNVRIDLRWADGDAGVGRSAMRHHRDRHDAGDLPVQFPTKFEMLVNRRTATALGLAIPPS